MKMEKKMSRRRILALQSAIFSTLTAGCSGVFGDPNKSDPSTPTRNQDTENKNETDRSNRVDGGSNLSSANFGVAAPSTTIQTFQIDNNSIHLVSWVTDPVYIATLSLTDMTIEQIHELPTGDGAWTTEIIGDKTYIGLFRPAHLYEYVPESGRLNQVESFQNDSFIWSSDTSDKSVFLGTYPTGSIYEYQTESDNVINHGQPDPTQEYVRSIAVTDNTIYAGIGSRAGLVTIDRESDERVDILPEEFEDESFIYDLELADDCLVARASPSGKIAIIERSTPTNYEILEQRQGGWFGQPTVNGPNVSFLGAPPQRIEKSTLYRYNLETEQMRERVTVPYRGPIDSKDEILYGVDSVGILWSYNSNTSQINAIDLIDAGFPSSNKNIYSMAIHQQTPVLAAHRELFFHDSSDEKPVSRVVPGEPKVMASDSQMLYLAIYGGAYLVEYNPQRDSSSVLSQIGNEQNRPRDLIYHHDRNSLFVGTEPDYGQLGGALSEYDLDTESLVVDRNIVTDQTIFSLATKEDLIFFGTDIRGGRGIDPTADRAVIAAWDPERRTKLWQTDIDNSTDRIVSIEALDDQLYGITDSGSIFQLDISSQSITRMNDGGFSLSLANRNGKLYSVSNEGIVSVSPQTLESERLISESGPISSVVFSEQNEVYVVADGLLKRYVLDME